MQKWLQIILALFILKCTLLLNKEFRSFGMSLRQLKLEIQLQSGLQWASTLFVSILGFKPTVKSFWLVKGQMKYVHLTFSTGTLHQLKSLIRPHGNMLERFTCLIQEEVTDAFHIGVLKVEFHSWIHKWLRLIGHFLHNGEDHSTRELRSGGCVRLSKDWTCCHKKSCGERKKHFLMVSVQRRRVGLRLFRKMLRDWCLSKAWSILRRSILTIHQQPSKRTISERYSLRFMVKRDRVCCLTIGCRNGTRTVRLLVVMLIHRREHWMFIMRSECRRK